MSVSNEKKQTTNIYHINLHRLTDNTFGLKGDYKKFINIVIRLGGIYSRENKYFTFDNKYLKNVYKTFINMNDVSLTCVDSLVDDISTDETTTRKRKRIEYIHPIEYRDIKRQRLNNETNVSFHRQIVFLLCVVVFLTFFNIFMNLRLT